MIASPESPADRMRHQLAHRPQGHALPGDFYRDQDFHELDLEHIFYRDWIFAGHDCEMQKPGDFFTMQIGAYPLIVTRDAAGTIHAHHNTCRHRGFKVCDAPRGSVRRFVCPYHQWTYDPDGSLIRARAMEQPDFDASRYGLKPAHAESVGGYIFVSVAETPPDFAPFRDMVAPYFAPFDLANAKLAHRIDASSRRATGSSCSRTTASATTAPARIPSSAAPSPKRPSFMRTTNNQGEGIIEQFWKAREAEGLPSRFQIAESGQYRVSRIPLMDDARSYTMSGKPAVGKLMGRVPARQSRHADVLPLPVELEPLPRRHGDLLPRPADRAEAHRGRRPNGWSTRMPSKASTTT